MTKKRKLPSPRVLRRLLSYDPETGELRWKVRPVWMFKGSPFDKRRARAESWNTRFAGKPALASVAPIGYMRGSILGIQLYAHRVAFALDRGYWPLNVDHISGDQLDNCRANLREVTRSQNQKNMRRPVNNRTGVVGVYWIPSFENWRASIKVNSKNIHLGCFPTKEDAIAARKAAEKKYGFHPNHGRN